MSRSIRFQMQIARLILFFLFDDLASRNTDHKSG